MRSVMTLLSITLLISCTPSVDDFLKTSDCTYNYKEYIPSKLDIAGAKRQTQTITISEHYDSAQIIDLAKCYFKQEIKSKQLQTYALTIEHKEINYKIAIFDFAPHGDWSQADDTKTIDQYEIKSKIWNKDYFNK